MLKLFPWDRDEKHVAENDKCLFFIEPDLTAYTEEDYGMYKDHKSKMIGWKVVIAQDKDTKQPLGYILYDDTGNPVYDTTNYEGMAVRIDATKLALEDENE